MPHEGLVALTLYCLACWGIGYFLEKEYPDPSLLMIMLAPVLVPIGIFMGVVDWLRGDW